MPFNKNFGQDTGHDDPDKGGNKPNKPVPGSPGNVGSRGTSRDPNGRWTDAEGRSRRNPGETVIFSILCTDLRPMMMTFF